MSPEDRSKRYLLLVGDAIRKGFRVVEDDDGVWVEQPARPRRPAVRLGTYPNGERALMAAAWMSQSFPEA